MFFYLAVFVVFIVSIPKLFAFSSKSLLFTFSFFALTLLSCVVFSNYSNNNESSVPEYEGMTIQKDTTTSELANKKGIKKEAENVDGEEGVTSEAPSVSEEDNHVS